MNKDLFDRIVAFIQPFVDNPQTRHQYLEEALYDPKLLGQIDFTIGATKPFVVALVKTVEAYNDADAVCSLMQRLTRNAGDEQQQEAKQLCAELRQQARATNTYGDLQAGDVVCGCTLVKQLGKGGNGEVWLAKQPLGDGNRDVAIKLFEIVET